MGYLGVIVFLGIIFLFLFVFTVKQQTAVVIERFGKFNSIRNPGLQFKIPIVDRVAGKMSLKIQQLDVVVETKTKDWIY